MLEAQEQHARAGTLSIMPSDMFYKPAPISRLVHEFIQLHQKIAMHLEHAQVPQGMGWSSSTKIAFAQPNQRRIAALRHLLPATRQKQAGQGAPTGTHRQHQPAH